MYKEILVPLDGSELSKTAIPHARELAKAFGSHVTLVAVIEPLRGAYSWAIDPYSVLAAESTAEWEERRVLESVECFLAQIRDELRTQCIVADYKIAEGDAGSVICDCARAIGADLIVMSTHGRSGIQRWVYGSVADKVLRGANVPVLLVRAHEQLV